MRQLWTSVPGVSGRMMRALACGVGAVLLAAASLHARNDGAVVSLSVVPTSGKAQVVIGVAGAVSVRDFVLREPDRIVVDITGATLGVAKGGYDRVARGGVLDVRYAQNQPNVVRVVLTLAGPQRYQVIHGESEIRVAVEGGDDFSAWRAGATTSRNHAPPGSNAAVNRPPSAAPMATVTMVQASAPEHLESEQLSVRRSASARPQVQQRPQQRRITISWDQANIREVIAAFAAFSGRTIIPASGVTGTVTAEIIDQPWDVAMRAILRANGYDAVEDPNGIIIVASLQSIAQRPLTEPLATRTVRLNYSRARSVADMVVQRLTRDCGAMVGGAVGGQAATQTGGMPAGGELNCPRRGAVIADTLTNSISITDAASAIADLEEYARSLDVRQPQVNIKAKIILVDRTQLEGLGLKYDVGTRLQHFNDLAQRVDSAGNPETGSRIFLGGNTISAIANATQNVPSAALRVVYSAALGAFDFTTFLEALQEVALLDVQAEPSVTTLNNRQATLSAGTQVPIRTTEPGTGGNAGGAFPQVTVDFRQTGIVLTVTPQITANRQILMRIHAENSEVQFQAGDVGAVFPTQVITNEMLVADGETAVMGGLTQTTVRMTKTGIPILVDLPLIGRLFGVTNRQETKRDLLILITPHIVDDGQVSMDPRRP